MSPWNARRTYGKLNKAEMKNEMKVEHASRCFIFPFDSFLYIKGTVFHASLCSVFLISFATFQKQPRIVHKRVTEAQLYTYCTSHSSLS